MEEPTVEGNGVCTVLEMKRAILVTLTTPRLDHVTAPRFGEVLTILTQAAKCKIVVDLTNCTYTSSAGLRVLYAARKQCKRWNRGDLVLANPQHVRDTLELVGFTRIFYVYDTAVEAVGNF